MEGPPKHLSMCAEALPSSLGALDGLESHRSIVAHQCAMS